MTTRLPPRNAPRSTTSPFRPTSTAERAALVRATRLHWVHWLVLAGSLLATLSAWHLTSREIEAKSQLRFDRQRGRIVELVLERLSHYEDALRGGIAFVRASGGQVDHAAWRRYANHLRLEERYPGVNGIGAIWPVSSAELATHLAEQRESRPGYRVFPEHSAPEHLPIVYVEPVGENAAAVGLDMAHETNRYVAAKRARDTGLPQITGPIVLVQDAQKTPGFLFFAPYYRGDEVASVAARQRHHAGFIYAPFIFAKLMNGVLARTTRQAGLRLTDGDEILFDELALQPEQYNPKSAFRSTTSAAVYGRTWRFDIQADRAFEASVHSSQPTTVLMAGLAIDGALLLLFLAMTRANRRAIRYADAMTEELRENESRLTSVNEEIAQFNYRTSHDLVGPLRTIQGFARLMRDDAKAGRADDLLEYVAQIDAQAGTLVGLVGDLLSLHRADHVTDAAEVVDLAALTGDIVKRLNWLRATSQVDVAIGPFQVANVLTEPTRLKQVLENLISNAIKYAKPGPGAFVKVTSEAGQAGGVVIQVADNGIGIPKAQQQAVFEMFTRLKDNDASGSGLGLYLVKKHVARMGGRVTLESGAAGTAVRVELPQPETP